MADEMAENSQYGGGHPPSANPLVRARALVFATVL
jgi:hypothetical protein